MSSQAKLKQAERRLLVTSEFLYVSVECREQGGRIVMCWAAIAQGRVIVGRALVSQQPVSKWRNLPPAASEQAVARCLRICVIM